MVAFGLSDRPSMPVDIPLDIWTFEYYRWDYSPNNTVRSSAKAWVAHDPDRRLFFYHCIDPAKASMLVRYSNSVHAYSHCTVP